MKHLLPAIFLMLMSAQWAPVYAIEGYKTRQEKKEIKEEQRDTRKMDGLSLWAYITAFSALASLFVVPTLSLLLFPAGLVMGIIALVQGKRRLEDRRGRGLAIAAVVLGGAFAALFVISFAIFLVAF
jgi:cobalamin biosynthesis protein CobD/CbiB